MMYLEYFLIIIIIILVYILFQKFNHKEGFEHIGDGYISKKPKPQRERGQDQQNNVDVKEQEIIDATKVTYNLADKFAYMVIKMPYDILSQGVVLLTQLIQQINAIIQPLKDFVQQMFNILKRLVKQIFDQFMKAFKQWFSIMRNLPDFIKKYLTMAVDFFISVSV